MFHLNDQSGKKKIMLFHFPGCFRSKAKEEHSWGRVACHARAVIPTGSGHFGTKPDRLGINQSGDNVTGHTGSPEHEKSHG